MKKLATLVTAMGLIALFATSALAANQVRISQVYGGGGASSGSPTYTQDYIELFNSGGTVVDISNWALEYGSATGNWGSSTGNYYVFPAGSKIQPCSYVLVLAGTPGSAGATNPVAGDFTGPMNLSATSGKVALFNALNSNVACGSETAGTLVDKVAYGTGTCAEGTAVALLSTTTGAVRNNGGNTDTDNNVSDFTIVTNPVPHDAASGPNANCQVTPTERSSWGQLKSFYR